MQTYQQAWAELEDFIQFKLDENDKYRSIHGTFIAGTLILVQRHMQELKDKLACESLKQAGY